MQDQSSDIESLKHEIAIKSDLISVSAHQLRTSLTSIKWILKMFLDGDFGELSAEQKTFLDKIFQSDERMIRLVNEMLSINHAEDTLDLVQPEAVDMVALVDETVFDFRSEAYKRGIELIFAKPASPIAPAMADKEKIRVVIQNLVENAIKYSNQGDRVVISIGEKDTTIELSVRDTGIGINPEDKDHIFTKFFRANNAKAQDTVGSGLGLYTSRRIVEKHNGSMRFESSGQGTTFFVDLPKA